MRPGIEEFLAEYGLEYFVADAHFVAAGQPVFLYRDYFPLPGGIGDAMSKIPRGARQSPHATYRIASRGATGSAVAFFRDPRTTLQVWSREHGYPGEFAYLEFHKKHWPGGLKLWRITDASGDLGSKTYYDPAAAVQKARLHARHFADLVKQTLAEAGARGPTVVCSPYDAELFGHWWFEGPGWLEQVGRELRQVGVTSMTLGEALEAVPPRATLSLPEGSWGEGGDHRVWLNRETEWTWDRVYSAEAEWVEHVARMDRAGADARRVLAQATRELLLLEASDWQFLITTRHARDYAERRVAEHYAEFKRLSEMARTLENGAPITVEAANTLHRLEHDDFCFPDLDPAWGRDPAPGA
jgi:1,4-alpha-glucan branching enzyme